MLELLNCQVKQIINQRILQFKELLMSHIEDQKKIALLEQYVDTLERQNFAKNGETTLLYEQLESLKQENEMLKVFIDATKTKWQEQRQALTQQLREKENDQVVSSRNFGDQLRNSVDINSLKAVAEDMRVELGLREEQIAQLCQDKQDLQAEIQILKQQLAQTTCKATKSQEKLRNQLQIAKQLENEIFGLKNSRSQNRTGISFAKLEVDKLVKQNNQLIEKIRLLEKQKNSYYNQLKMASPLKTRPNQQENKSAQKRSQGPAQGKSQRWNLMQEKLRAIRNENEQLKANLAIH